MNVVYPWREAPAADFAVIGDPVSHSLSPLMHQAAYDELGLPFRYVAVHVPAGEVGPALDRLASLGYQGVNVTVPHKEEVLSWCQGIDPLAARVRAANTIRLADRACINTDAPGFIQTLRDCLIEGLLDCSIASDSDKTPIPSTGGSTAEAGSIIRQSSNRQSSNQAIVLGAGGSARALAYALAKDGWQLRVFNRTRARAEEMLDGLGIEAELLDSPDPAGAALILNTTSASLQGASLGIDWSRAPKEALAYDLMYAKGGTPFLREAAEHGLATIDGLPLLAAQGALAFEWWIGVPAPSQTMLRAIREAQS